MLFRLTTMAAVLAGAFVPHATPATGLRAQPNQALTHVGHVAAGFPGAPGGRGLAVTAAVEVNAAMQHANIAAAHPGDLDAIKTSVRHALYALDPASGSTGPGLGYGVIRAANDIAEHIERAAGSPDASGTIRTLGPNVANAARAVAGRAHAMAELGARILAASSAAEATPMVERLRAMALELDTGQDANDSGRIDPDAIEPGLNQLEAAVYAILDGEKLPRVLS